MGETKAWDASPRPRWGLRALHTDPVLAARYIALDELQAGTFDHAYFQVSRRAFPRAVFFTTLPTASTRSSKTPKPADCLFHLPTGPGLGLQINEAGLAKRRVPIA